LAQCGDFDWVFFILAAILVTSMQNFGYELNQMRDHLKDHYLDRNVVIALLQTANGRIIFGTTGNQKEDNSKS